MALIKSGTGRRSIRLVQAPTYVLLLAFFICAPCLAGQTDATQLPALRVGVIGLDTSHSIAFTEVLHDPQGIPALAGFRVVAAYPGGSADIPQSIGRVAGFTQKMRDMNIEIVGSVESLLERVDVVLLESMDGRVHLDQALAVIRSGKPVFIDKPFASSLPDILLITRAARERGVPVFSSSPLRYAANAQAAREGRFGAVTGADTYSPAILEPNHPDLFWYGIHGVESLFTIMGTGCESVARLHTGGADIVVGTWPGGRMGVFRGLRQSALGYGGTLYTDKEIVTIGPYGGYRPLVIKIAEFFRTGVAPVSLEETIEIYAFMAAADESKRRGGAPVKVSDVLDDATRVAAGRWRNIQSQLDRTTTD